MRRLDHIVSAQLEAGHSRTSHRPWNPRQNPRSDMEDGTELKGTSEPKKKRSRRRSRGSKASVEVTSKTSSSSSKSGGPSALSEPPAPTQHSHVVTKAETSDLRNKTIPLSRVPAMRSECVQPSTGLRLPAESQELVVRVTATPPEKREPPGGIRTPHATPYQNVPSRGDNNEPPGSDTSTSVPERASETSQQSPQLPVTTAGERLPPSHGEHRPEMPKCSPVVAAVTTADTSAVSSSDQRGTARTPSSLQADGIDIPAAAVNQTSMKKLLRKPSARMTTGTGTSEEQRRDFRRDSCPAASVAKTSAANDVASKQIKSSRKSRLYKRISLRDLEHLAHKSPRLPTVDNLASFRNLLIVVIAIAVIILGAFSVVLVLLHSTQSSTVNPRVICSTTGCVSHATLLTFHLNRSIDPCDDFHAYVCSAWKSQPLHYEFGESAMKDLMYTWFRQFNKTLHDGALKLPVGRKPMNMYSACMADKDGYGTSVDKLMDVMHDIGLAWPEDPPPASDAFAVMIYLSFNFEDVAWFRATVFDRRNSLKKRFVLAPAITLPAHLQQHHVVREAGTYYDYWKAFYKVLDPNDNAEMANEDTVHELARTEMDLLVTFYKAMQAPVKEPASFPFRSISKYTRNISSERWLTTVNANTGHGQTFSADDEVIVSDETFFKTVGGVLSAYSNLQLLRYFSWIFVQVHGPKADQRLFLPRFVWPDRAHFLRPAYCASSTEISYEQLVSSLAYASRFSIEERNLVDAKYKKLIETAVMKIVASHWLDEDSKKMIVRKLNRLVLRLWPPSEYLKNDQLEQFYKNFTAHEPTFGGFWANASRSRRQGRGFPGFPDKAYGRVSFFPPYAAYDPLTNSVRVAFGALSGPMYYNDGTEGMFYGGLGHLMASEIVKSFGNDGLKWNWEGEITESFLSESSRKAFLERSTCLESGSAFPHIPAIEIAYSALLDTLANDSQPVAIREDLSEEKVFLMTLCYVTCKKSSALVSVTPDCNAVVRNFPPFAKVFNCPKGSRMNPERQCTFFE
ncbi:membrane metallo-endopeptidase-like 1 [Dermacentor albipictus]|uniref:membrane metallo-endopeptidase-like 1 n=1 Tax=Dermacentor albipictus TaxID=60249 RepID=UPI0031FBA6A8